MRAVVLGGSGFIGSHVIEALCKQGFDIINYSRSGCELILDGVKLVQADLHNTAKLGEALEGCDIVVHCLSETVPATSALDPMRDVSGNLVGTMQLLELMRKKKIQRLVFLSSGGAVYGVPASNPISEDHPRNPISSYGAVKVAIENFINVAAHEWGLQATIIRPSNPYGERQGHRGVQGLIGTLIHKAHKGEQVTIYGDGNIIRDYLYVRDLAELVGKASVENVPGVFNCGSGQGHSINEIVLAVERATGIEISRKYVEKRVFDVPAIVLNCERAFKSFGWRPSTAIESGIKRQLASIF